MKKTLILLAAVLLIAGLFVACSADLNSADETASVYFGEAAKALTPTPSVDVPDVDELIWWYKAEKENDPTAHGTTDGWVRINPNGVGFATLNGFKIGSGWTFTIAGKTPAVSPAQNTKPADNYADCIYYGASDSVSLTRGANTINISLTIVAPDFASVIFSEISVYEMDAYHATGDHWAILETGVDDPIATGVFNYPSTISTSQISIDAGAMHTYTVNVYDAATPTNNIIATQSVTFYAYPGSTTTVTGDMGGLNAASVNFNTETVEALLLHGTTITPYAYLADALSDANDNDTVVIVRDINIIMTNDNKHYIDSDRYVAYPIGPKDITIDGNNHTITASRGESYTGSLNDLFQFNTNGVTYQVEDAHWIMKDITINATGFQSAINAVAELDHEVVLDLVNVTILTDGECVYSNGEVTVNVINCTMDHSGEYTAGKDAVYYSALIVGYNGVLNVSGGSIGSTGRFANAVSAFPSGGSITLSDVSVAVLVTDFTDLPTGNIIWCRNEDYVSYPEYTGNSTITINSGTYDGKIYITQDWNTKTSTPHLYSEVFINGGTFIHFGTDGTHKDGCDYTGDTGHSYKDHIVITGGTFDADPQAYVPGYTSAQSYDTTGYIIIGNYIITRTGESSSYTYKVSYDL